MLSYTGCHVWIVYKLNLGTHIIMVKTLPKIKKQVLERCILISSTNSNKEHTNRDTTIPTILFFSNESIKIGDKTVFYKSCFENSIKFSNTLTNNDGSINTYDELKATYNVTINFLTIFRSGKINSCLEENLKSS